MTGISDPEPVFGSHSSTHVMSECVLIHCCVEELEMDIVTETAIVSFRTLPVGFPLLAVSLFPFNADASSLSRTDILPTVGEESEDEEDEEEERLSCFIGVLKDDEDAEEELDKPGTTIGTKFSVLQIIRIPSSMRCGF